MYHIYQTKLGEGRRMAIPAEVCQQLHLNTGDPLMIEIHEDGLHVKALGQIICELQHCFATYKTDGQSEVEELIRQRRQELGQVDTNSDA